MMDTQGPIQTVVNKTLHRKLKIKRHETPLKTGGNSDTLEWNKIITCTNRANTKHMYKKGLTYTHAKTRRNVYIHK